MTFGVTKYFYCGLAESVSQFFLMLGFFWPLHFFHKVTKLYIPIIFIKITPHFFFIVLSTVVGWLARWTWFSNPRSFRCINPLRITRAMLRGRACFPFRGISSLVRLFPASSEILLHLLLTLRFFVGRELPRGKLSAANIFFVRMWGFAGRILLVLDTWECTSSWCRWESNPGQRYL